jgi:nicotinate-nucleotide adenylyltransferase
VTPDRDTILAQAPQGPIGILGGSFDPVHNGHLRTAIEVLERCRLSAVRLVPSGCPPHRAAPVASAELRLRMLLAAARSEPRLIVDDRELRRSGPSYTVDSLASLRAESGAQPLCLLLGADAFLGLPTWHRWREIFDLAHIVVLRRPGWELAAGGELGEQLAQRRSDDPQALRRAPAGAIRLEAVTQLDIASSAIRALAAAGGDPRFLVPDPVRDIIVSTGCYQKQAGSPAGSTEVPLRA